MIRFGLTGGLKGEATFFEPQDLNEIDYFMKCPLVSNRAFKNKKVYYNYPNTFDIESTTIDCDNPYGFMYAFMLHYNGKNILGRRWEDFITIIENVSKYNTDGKVVFYVHYLAYEFQFIKDFFEWDEIFALDSHKVLRCTWRNIEFRCSYYLSNMNLEKFCESGKSVTHLKQAGHFDYKKIRTCETTLNDEELTYMYCDVAGLNERLLETLEEDNMITVPYTSTGYVRRNCRNVMKKNKANRDLFLKTQINEKVYELLQEAMRGGNTHGNARHVNCILHGVRCFDIASSYPFVMMTKYFPVSVFMQGNPKTKRDFKKYLEKYCCLFRAHFINLRLKDNVPVPYISEHKCYTRKNELVFNGRIVEADIISTTLTEIDYNIIEQEYEFDDVAISDFYFAERGPLPKELKIEIMSYFYNKTTLKGVDAYMYAKSKNLLNSIFGMACTNPVRDIIEYQSRTGEWEKRTSNVKTALEDFYKSYNSFLPYQWGIWVTAHARLQLEKILRITKHCTVYVDTDSNKCVGLTEEMLEEIKKLNDEIMKEAEEHGAFVDYNGKRYYMGVFEEEETCDEFITMGAKKYAYMIDGKLYITVSGVSKELGALEMTSRAKKDGIKPLEEFKEGFVFRNAGRTTHYYNESKPHYITVAGDKFLTASNVGIVDATYTLGQTKTFKDFLDFLEYYID